MEAGHHPVLVGANLDQIPQLVGRPQTMVAQAPTTAEERIPDLALIPHLGYHAAVGGPQADRSLPATMGEAVGRYLGDGDNEVVGPGDDPGPVGHWPPAVEGLEVTGMELEGDSVQRGLDLLQQLGCLFPGG